ncbi:hypothetical protein L9F63_003706, partial [Diploptera punctata]
MPFYGANTGPLPPQPGGMVDPAGGFAPPLRDRFPNSVWHPASGTDPNSVGTWAPQGQFMQQIPPQLDDLRYHHHPQYPSSAPYHQPPSAPGTVNMNTSNVNGLPSSHNGTSSGAVNGVNGGAVHRTSGMNGQYMDTSPSGQYSDQREYVNGGNTYNPSQDVTMAPPPSTTPTSRSSSVHMETSSDASAIPNVVLNNGTKTSTSAYNNPNPSITSTANPNSTGHPNALPGYLPHPQIQHQQLQQQSLHNSSRYSGQENSMGDTMWNVPVSSSDGRMVWTEENKSETSTSMYREDDRTMQNGMPNEAYERVNLNSRLKTMILNKQQQQQMNHQMQQYNQQVSGHHGSAQSDANAAHQIMSPGDQQRSQPQYMSSSGMMSQGTETRTSMDRMIPSNQTMERMMVNFLAQGHHPRNQSSIMTSEGGGFPWDWNNSSASDVMDGNSISAMENFIKYAANEDRSGILNKSLGVATSNNPVKQYIPNNTSPANLQKSNRQTNNKQVSVSSNNDKSFQKRMGIGQGNRNDFQNSYGPIRQDVDADEKKAKGMTKTAGCQYQPDFNPNVAQMKNEGRKMVPISVANNNYFNQQGYDPSTTNIKTENRKPVANNVNTNTSSGFHYQMYERVGPRNDVRTTIANNVYPCQNYEQNNNDNSNNNRNNNNNKNNSSSGCNEGRSSTPVEKVIEPMKVKQEHPAYLFAGDGGPIPIDKIKGSWCCRQGGTETPTPEHLRDGCCQGFQTADEQDTKEPWSPQQPEPNPGETSPNTPKGFGGMTAKEFQDHLERLKNNVRAEVPDCNCFPPDKCPPEPGSYYTHLGAASSLEGKTTQGCPLAKWQLGRASLEEKILCIVKHRQGHKCPTSWIVVVMVAWEGVPSHEADRVYNLLTHKLNRYGLPTTRRCATNEPRTCACQGLDPDTCGASFSFGCSWSMYYNGCKYARSKTVRKFRLSVRSEEQEVEERMHVLATLLSPLYQSLAPEAFKNQTQFEREASECRLGFKPGRPFSGVTACIDFCAHSHRDLHNMNNGCTVSSKILLILLLLFTQVVSLTKHRTLSKPDDEQLHVLPLYVMDDTDEFGSKEGQEAKVKSGAVETLTKFPCEVRVRAVPLQPCRRHGKKRKEDEPDAVIGRKDPTTVHRNPCPVGPSAMGGMDHRGTPMSLDMASMLEGMEAAQLQSSQLCCLTMLDSPVSMYQGWGYHHPQGADSRSSDVYGSPGASGASSAWGHHRNQTHAWMAAEAQRKQNWLNSAAAATAVSGNLASGNLSGWGSSDYGAFGGGSAGLSNDREGRVDPDSTTNHGLVANSVGGSSTLNPQQSPVNRSYNNFSINSPTTQLNGQSQASTPSSPFVFQQSTSPWQASQQQQNSSNDLFSESGNSQASVSRGETVNWQASSSRPSSGLQNNLNVEHSKSSTKLRSPMSAGNDCGNASGKLDRSPYPSHLPPSPFSSPQPHQTASSPQQSSLPPPSPSNPSNSSSTQQPSQQHAVTGDVSMTQPHTPQESNSHSVKTPERSVSVPLPLTPTEHSTSSSCSGSSRGGWVTPDRPQSSWDYNPLTPAPPPPSSPTQASPFRIPKGRPPSRSSTLHSNNNSNSSFLKPYPPGENSASKSSSMENHHHQASDQGAKSHNSNEARPMNSNKPNGNQAIKSNMYMNNSNSSDADDSAGSYSVFPEGKTYPSRSAPHMNVNYPYQTMEFNPQFYGNQTAKHEAAARSACYHSTPYGYQGMSGMGQFHAQYPGPSSQYPGQFHHHRWDPRWDLYGPPPFFPVVPEPPRSEPIGEVTDYIDNEECFKDSQMGGVAIALGHGSVLFECAKHELHSTTALRRPNRLHPTRISLVFYQHRNLNRAKHGWDEWEEKMRLRKLGITTSASNTGNSSSAAEQTMNVREPGGPYCSLPSALLQACSEDHRQYSSQCWSIQKNTGIMKFAGSRQYSSQG